MITAYFCLLFWAIGYWLGRWSGKLEAKDRLEDAAFRERFLHMVARDLVRRLAEQDQEGEEWKNA